MHFSFYCVISDAFLVSFSSVGKRTFFLCSKIYPCTAQFLVILLLHPRNFQLCFSFEIPESLAILPDLPKPIYLSLPISPWCYIAVRVLVRSINTESFYLSSLVILRSLSSGSKWIDLKKVKQALLLGPVLQAGPVYNKKVFKS